MVEDDNRPWGTRLRHALTKLYVHLLCEDDGHLLSVTSNNYRNAIMVGHHARRRQVWAELVQSLGVPFLILSFPKMRRPLIFFWMVGNRRSSRRSGTVVVSEMPSFQDVTPWRESVRGDTTKDRYASVLDILRAVAVGCPAELDRLLFYQYQEASSIKFVTADDRDKEESDEDEEEYQESSDD